MAASVTSHSEARSPARARVGLVALVALGATLARRGPMAVVSLAVCVLTALVLAVVAVSFARRGGDAPVHDVPLLASAALAWGGGFLLAFSSSVSALRRDRLEGIRHLFVARTTSLRGYLLGRIGGLAVVLAAAVGGGTLLTGLVALLAATTLQAVPRTAQATFASLVFALAFAAVMAPIAFAALGARSRMSGYLFLIGILVVPEIVAGMLTGPLPSEATELCALPSALAALRGALAPGTVDLFRFLRALVALLVFAMLALVFVRRDVVLLERGDDA